MGQLLQPLKLAYAATLGFGAFIPGVKEHWANLQKAAMSAVVPVVEAGCAAAQPEEQPAVEPEELAPAPLPEHVTKKLLKQLVKEELSRT